MNLQAVFQSVYYTFFAGSTYVDVSGKQVKIPNSVIFLLVFIVFRMLFNALARMGLRGILKPLKLV